VNLILITAKIFLVNNVDISVDDLRVLRKWEKGSEIWTSSIDSA
jgi:hypothetical protein